MEQWKKFEETDKKDYFVSTTGRVKSIDKTTGKEFMRKSAKQITGYYAITIQAKNTYYVHRLVAQEFIPNLENKPTVNHRNGDKSANNVENLEWSSYSEQQEHAYETGLKTGGKTPAIVLDSNGFVIARHETMTEALSSYQGRKIHYTNDIQIIGNVIVMKQTHYDTLSEDEVFSIVTRCFERMMEFAYIVDGQLAYDVAQATDMADCKSNSAIYLATKGKWSSNVKGHEVSRVKNRIGVFKDDSKEEPVYETVYIK
ncbi:NUMOD4 motif-containing HNH endonuclease [Bacillus sp. F19]|nr:NUMOD4 motif-containing HNH endonuclease [Bacillus sp. F19]